MNEHVVPKMTNFHVVKLSNSPAITCVPRLELDHFESQPDSPRINQRFLNSFSREKNAGCLIPQFRPDNIDQFLTGDITLHITEKQIQRNRNIVITIIGRYVWGNNKIGG